MNAVKDQVVRLVEIELAAANEKYPAFHSAHEGYAVLLEEVEEARDDIETIIDYLGYAWNNIRYDSNPAGNLKTVKARAEQLACEAIQVAAMAQKFLDVGESHDENL